MHDSIFSGDGYRLYQRSVLDGLPCAAGEIALTVTSPPYWNAIDYDTHSSSQDTWYRTRKYGTFGQTFSDYLNHIEQAFLEVLRVTKPGGFCALVVGTILDKGKHYPAPMMITQRLQQQGWEFHQDIVWNKVTGGVKRAGVFIQKPHAGYYYPNIMTEYILIFRKPGPVWRDSDQALPIDELFKRDIANNIWHIAPVPPKQIDHPCPFPAELVRRLVLLYSCPGDLVLDPFLGSGQTALVALQHQRRFIGCDIQLAYLELTRQRLSSPPVVRKYQLIPSVRKGDRHMESLLDRNFEPEYAGFELLRGNCTADAKSDYESAIRQLLGNYNTTIHENRFVVGGAIESFTCALLRSAQVECALAEKGGIILQECPNERPRRQIGFLSVNGSFSGKIRAMNVINTQGDSASEWNTATLFVISEVGIVFATPDTGDLKNHTSRRKDAVVLSKTGLECLINTRTDLVFPMDIPVKPGKFSRVLRPSRVVAQSILSSFSLGKYLD